MPNLDIGEWKENKIDFQLFGARIQTRTSPFFSKLPFPRKQSCHTYSKQFVLSVEDSAAQPDPNEIHSRGINFCLPCNSPHPVSTFSEMPRHFHKMGRSGKAGEEEVPELSRECMERPTRIYCKQQCSPHPKRTQCRGGRHIPDDVMAQSWIIRTSRDFRRLYNLMSHKGSPFTEVPRGQSVTGANCLFYGTRGH